MISYSARGLISAPVIPGGDRHARATAPTFAPNECSPLIDLSWTLGEIPAKATEFGEFGGRFFLVTLSLALQASRRALRCTALGL